MLRDVGFVAEEGEHTHRTNATTAKEYAHDRLLALGRLLMCRGEGSFLLRDIWFTEIKGEALPVGCRPDLWLTDIWLTEIFG